MEEAVDRFGFLLHCYCLMARPWDKRKVREQEDPRVRIWLRVRLGGQRMSEVASACRYRDGSGVYRVIQRLEARAREDRKLAAHLSKLERIVKSSSVIR